MANAGAIDTVLVPGCRALVPAEVWRNGGTYVAKTGYHNSRNNLRRDHPGDYSIQTDKDQRGPGDKGSAFDWVFEDARLKSDFSTIAKFSRRLYKAGQDRDPRAYPLREFYGNIDSDRQVEGWSFYRDRPGSSDSTHLWHIHFSVWRQYINDENAMRSILSILRGEDDEDMPLNAEDLAKIKKLMTSPDVINAIADAVLTRDGVIENPYPDKAANSHISVETMLERLARDTMAKP